MYFEKGDYFYDKPNCLVINGKVFKVDKDVWDDKLSVDQIKIAINYLELILTDLHHMHMEYRNI